MIRTSLCEGASSALMRITALPCAGILLLIAGLAPLPLRAETPQWIDRWPEDGIQRFNAPGYEVTVQENDDLSQTLRVNGAVAMTAAGIVLEEAWTLPDGIALIGSDGMGQRRCAADRFLLWLSEGGFRVDGQISSCSPTEVTRSGDGLAIRSAPVPAEQTLEWDWRPTTGLSAPESSVFHAEYHIDWEDFTPLADLHPQRLLDYQDVYAPLHQDLSPEDLGTLVEILEGMGSGVITGGTYIGSACDPFSCQDRFAWIWIDAGTRGVYSLWQEEPGAALWHPATRDTWPLWILAEAQQAMSGAMADIGE